MYLSLKNLKISSKKYHYWSESSKQTTDDVLEVAEVSRNIFTAFQEGKKGTVDIFNAKGQHEK